MYHTTGFGHDEVVDLCVIINSAERDVNAPKMAPCLGLFKSVAAALTYMRHNRTQAEIGESFGVTPAHYQPCYRGDNPAVFHGPGRIRFPPPTTSTRKPSTSWTAPCCPAGHGPGTRNSTQGSTRPPG